MSRSLEENLNILKEISELKENWNGYGSEPIPAEAIEMAQGLLNAMPYQPLEIYPTAKATIVMEFSFEGRKINMEIMEDDIEIVYLEGIKVTRYDPPHTSTNK